MASEGGVKLLGAWPSPFVIRARIALNIKSVAYEFVEENVLVSKSDLLLKSNPVHKKVPVLIHGESSICESLIIVEYVDEAWADGPSILPADPYDRAIARFWAAYVDSKLFPSLWAILLSDGEEAKSSALVEEAAQALGLLENALGKCSKGETFFGGAKIGYLDIALGGFLAWMRVLQIKANVTLIGESSTPNLFRWAHEFSADPMVKDVLPETDKLAEFGDFIAAKLKGAHGSK